MRRLQPLLLVAALVLAAAAIQPGPVAAGTEPPTDISTAYNTQRKIVRSADGEIWVAITVNASGAPRVQVLRSPDGLQWSSLPPPSLSSSWSDRPALAIDSQGHLHLAWTEPAGTNRQVFYAGYDGTAWSLAEQLSHSPGYAGFPSIAVDASDRVHVVWYGFDGSYYQIYYRRLDSSGWTAERALTTESVDATNPAIALGPEGDVHVAWFRVHRTGAYNEIAYLRLHGEVVIETGAISAPGVDAIDPSLVVDGSGTVHVLWTALVDGVDRIQAIQNPGTWSAVETVSPATIGAQHASLALDFDSHLYVAWESLDGRIYLQWKGAAWSDPGPVSSSGQYPSLRWSQAFNPLCGTNAVIDLAWTARDSGTPRLGYFPISTPAGCPQSPSGIAVGMVLAVAGAATVIGISTFAVWLRRRWYPKPPRSP